MPPLRGGGAEDPHGRDRLLHLPSLPDLKPLPTRGVFLLPAGGPSPTEDRTFGVRRKPAPAFLPFEQLDSPPAAVVQAMPRFPAALIGHVDRGWAEVDFLVDESGRVRVPVVRRESAREFGDAALAVISRWRFTAPRRHGRPVVAAAGWRFEFEPAAPRAENAK